ncbi:biliverdin-producing heme oxygenase [Emticicia sp. 17c]|uniref:biliverdin-producing heme oxygenase n=1 Tax=Emticicia sp. 17c TaxID=3127704 RepID=UPI00301DBAEE
MNQEENIITKIRIHTAQLHSELEKTSLSASLMAENVSQQDYIAYLQRMREVVAFYEKNVFPVLSDTLNDFPRREKLVLIEQDLNYFLSQSTVFNTFTAQTVIHDSVPYALGCMYVMEGSTLGGKIILKHINKTLGIAQAAGGTYFTGYGDNTGYFWKTFLQTLSDYSMQNACDEEIIKGAKDTFTAIKNYFEQAHEVERYS